MSFLLPEGRELFRSIQKMYASFLISSEIQSFLVFLPIKVQHDFSEVKICIRTRFPVDSRFNGRPVFVAIKDFLCSFLETKLKQALKQPPLMILETVFPIGCRKAGPYNQ
jgi:hypothetical protein